MVINEERRPAGEHARRYNRPLSNEIGILMPDNNTHNRDIVLRIIHWYTFLSFIEDMIPFIFPYGTDGWHINL